MTERRDLTLGDAPADATPRHKREWVAPTCTERPLLTALWRGRFTSFRVPELDHIRFVCMVDGRRAATQLGFRPRRSLKETIRAIQS